MFFYKKKEESNNVLQEGLVSKNEQQKGNIVTQR